MIVVFAVLLSVGFTIDSFFGVPDNERRRYEQSVGAIVGRDT